MSSTTAKAHKPWTTDKHPSSTSALLSSLHDLREANPKAVRATVHHYRASVYAPDDKGEGPSSNRDRRITSWKMTEHLYFSAANQFPTLARGLFTEVVEEGEEVPQEAVKGEGTWQGPRERIVARGYDKFFNIDEVDWTKWEHMRDHTQGPYRLTLKSNGCLILISALSPKHVLVASKHSLGTTTESQVDASTESMSKLDINGTPDPAKAATKGKAKEEKTSDESETAEVKAHAEVGRKWLRRTLEKSGKTEAELAQRLWDSNTTAVLELCDDSFEEHVIATPEYWTGLHLHGLNHNTPHFSTALPAEVSSFAADFGFIPTKYVEVPTLDALKELTDEIAQSGEWEGDQIEGFVVRCTVAESTAEGKPPYKPGAPFFFKVKFDEPYLLYRQWREITRALLPLRETDDKQKIAEVWKKVRGKAAKRQELAVYADWAGDEMTRNPELFDGYDRGVVRVREVFLRWTEEEEGQKAWKQAKKGKYQLRGGQPQKPAVDKSTLPKKHILVPIAVPGTGKTLIGVALAELFGFGHTQSDDVTTKKTAPTFLKNIAGLLQKTDVVYADRNNHIDKHYDEIADLVEDKQLRKYDVHLIGIVWDIESKPYHRMLRVCSERVVKRGDNHQTLRPDLTVEAEHEAVVSSFLRRWTSPDPALFDKLITVQVEDTPREALDQIIDGLAEPLNLDKPNEQAITDALAAAEAYKTSTPYHPPAQKSGKAIRYFGVAPEIDLPLTVSTILAKHNDSSAQALFDHLRTVDRVASSPHITLAHEKLVEAEKLENPEATGPYEGLWNTCKSQAESSTSPLYEFEVTLLVWDDRCMALALDHLKPLADGPELVLPDEIAAALHVTVGTRSEDVAPYESRGVVKKAREAIAAGGDVAVGECDEVVEGGGKVRWVAVDGVKSEGRVRGMS